ncbi:hypothetical protein WJX84_010368 [Apatococcus fuscideae]
MLAAVDSDGSGEVELPEFIEIMTMTREVAGADKEITPCSQPGNEPEAVSATEKEPEEVILPMNLLTIAFRRKKIMDGVMYNEDGTRGKLIQKGQLAEQR